jgi:hypothetical protein
MKRLSLPRAPTLKERAADRRKSLEMEQAAEIKEIPHSERHFHTLDGDSPRPPKRKLATPTLETEKIDVATLATDAITDTTDNTTNDTLATTATTTTTTATITTAITTATDTRAQRASYNQSAMPEVFAPPPQSAGVTDWDTARTLGTPR